MYSGLLQQRFVVGPGFSPILAKTVNQIVTGKYMKLSELLSVNIVESKLHSHVLLDGRLVLTPISKRQCHCIEDIVTGTDALTIFSFILTSYFPR